jgi:hypothetical protein
MRPELLKPVRAKRHLRTAIATARELYALHEAGGDCSKRLPELSEIVGHPVSVPDLHSAFGSVSPEDFAEDLLRRRSAIPTDLSDAEMLELIERVCNGDGTDSQICHWLNCLEVNTGDERLSDLIFWPGIYFGDDDNGRELTPEEILRTARAKGLPASN